MSQEEVMTLLHEIEGSITSKEIAKRLNVNLRTIQRTLKKLVSQELIFVERLEKAKLGGMPGRIYKLNPKWF